MHFKEILTRKSWYLQFLWYLQKVNMYIFYALRYWSMKYMRSVRKCTSGWGVPHVLLCYLYETGRDEVEAVRYKWILATNYTTKYAKFLGFLGWFIEYRVNRVNLSPQNRWGGVNTKVCESRCG